MRITLVAAAVLAAALTAAPAGAQTSKVHYEITSSAKLQSRAAANARTLATVDSGTVIQIEGTEELGPTHTRVTWNGQSGWIENSLIRRVVTVQDAPVRVADTVRVVRVDTVIRVDTIRLERARKP